MKATRVCSVDGCQLPHFGRGYCRGHNQRVRRTGEPGPAAIVDPRRVGCSEPGCDGEHAARGLCNRHYKAARKAGLPAAVGQTARPSQAGAANPRWKGDAIGTTAAHDRVRRLRGRAADYPCIACGGVAADWAYDYTDPDPLVDPEDGPYSPDPTKYRPMCRACHKRFDQAQAVG